MIVVVLILLAAVSWYVHYRRSRKLLYELSGKLLTAGDVPVLGHSLWFIGGPETLLKNIKNLVVKLQDVPSDVGKVWIGPHLYIIPFNLDDVQNILENCLEKDYTYKFLRTWLGNGLFVAPIELWKLHRRFLVPIFHNRIVEEYIGIFGKQAAVLVERLEAQVGKPEFDVNTYVTSCMLDVVFETAMGEKMDVQNNPDTPYLRARHTVISIISMRLFKPWLQPDAMFNLTSYATLQKDSIQMTHHFTDEVVIKKRQSAVFHSGDDDEGQKDMLELLLMKNRSFSNRELREHIDSITIAGNDTTALVISYVLVMLGGHQDVQEALHHEIMNIFGDSMRSPTKEDLNKMDYLERVIKETMRLYTVVPIIGRKTLKEIKLTSCTLPAGVGCAVLPFVFHKDKRLWGEDADSFNPDRFLPEKCAARHPCAYIPFSFGARNCIGRHFGMYAMKSILSSVVRSYRITAPPCDRFKIEILLFPVNGHQIKLIKRM